MPNVSTMSSAASAPTNARVGGMSSRQSNGFNAPDTPTFSQALSASESAQVQPQLAPKTAAPSRPSRTSSASNDSDSTTAVSHDTRRSEPQANSALPMLMVVPITATPVPLPIPPARGTDTNSADPSGAQGTLKTSWSAGRPAVQGGSATSTNSETTKSDASAAEAIDFDEMIEAGESDDALQSDVSQDTDAAAARTQTQPPLASGALPQLQQDGATLKDAQGTQLSTASSSVAPQPIDHIQLHLPSTATLVSATADASASASSNPQSTTQVRQLIAQHIQSALPSLDSTSQTTAAQPLQVALAGNNNSPSNGNSSGSANSFASQYGGHQPAQSSSQSSDTSHGSNDTKPSGASDSAQSPPQSNATNAPQANAATTTTGPNAAALVASSAHASAQVAAQADAAAATASTKSGPSSAASGNQSAPLAPSLPAPLPRSLTDVSQATQLYQRLGGGEMHIAMNTDLLGSIDLRAVVHQGSLSATIGVQHSDIQTLLVNELPVLQHSLSEKNLQVGQISVLADSIGSGANPNSQPRQDQQGRQSASPAPAFRDSASPVALPPSATIAAAAPAGNSARLSVLA